MVFFMTMNLARYSIILAVSSPTGLMNLGGSAKPYCENVGARLVGFYNNEDIQSQYPSNERHMNT
jgi:hypothetical protein